MNLRYDLMRQSQRGHTVLAGNQRSRLMSDGVKEGEELPLKRLIL